MKIICVGRNYVDHIKELKNKTPKEPIIFFKPTITLNSSSIFKMPVCDGFFFKDQIVGVVGGGDTAAEEALYLSKLTSQVNLIVRRDEMRASTIMQNRVLDNEKINIYWNSEVKEVLGDDSVNGIDIINNKTKEVSNIKLVSSIISFGKSSSIFLFL